MPLTIQRSSVQIDRYLILYAQSMTKVTSLFVCVHLVVQMGIFSVENLGCFPQGKPAATGSRYPTLIKHKVHAWSFRVFVIHRTLTWTTGSLTSVRDHSYACVDTGVGHTDSESAQHFLLGKTLKFFWCSWRRRGSNLGSVDLESDALATEPPCHPRSGVENILSLNFLRF